MKEFSWKAAFLSGTAIIASVGIFLMLINYFRTMVNLTAGMRAYSNLAIIVGLGVAELAFVYLIGAYLNACAAKRRLAGCFLSTMAVIAGIYSTVFFLRYMFHVRILGRKLSFETIGSVPMEYLPLFIASLATAAVCLALRSFVLQMDPRASRRNP